MLKRRWSRTSLALTLILAACVLVPAQTPPPPSTTRPTTSTPQDATRPPAVSNPNPQAPPATRQATTPPNSTQPERTTIPDASTNATSGADVSAGKQATPEKIPLSTLLEPRPVPPMPSLQRLGIAGGDTLPLSLKDAVRLALENSNEIEVARGEVMYNETTLLSLEAFYDPVFRLTPEIINSVIPTASTLGGSDQSGTVTTTDLNLNTAVVKPFRTGGGQYEFFFNNTRETTSSAFAQLSPFYSSNFGVQFTQPLWRNRSIDLVRRSIRVQRKLLAQTDTDFRRRVTEIISEVQRGYWDLVFALREQQNQVANVNVARELFRQAETRIGAGSIAPLERAEVQTELASREIELIAATQNVSVAENNLKRMMLRDPLAKEWSSALLPTDEPSFDETPVRLADAIAEARANRPELERLRLQSEINDIDVQYFKNQARPRVDLRATVSTTGLAGAPVTPTGSVDGITTAPGASGSSLPLISGDPTTDSGAFLLAQINQLRSLQGLGPASVPLVNTETETVPDNRIGGYGQTLRNLFGLKTRNIVVGVVIEVPFKNKRARADLAGARVRQTQLLASTRMQEQNIEVEVRNAAQAVESAYQRVLAARITRENAELQQQGEQRLYEVGRSTTFLIFQRENQLTNARSLELRAQTDYHKALADLQRATSTTLRSYDITLEIPSASW